MKPRILIAVGAVLAALAALWFVVLRDRPAGGRKTATAASPVGERPGDSGRGDRRPDGPDRMRGGDPGTVQEDDDPAGTQRLEGLVLTADEQPVAGAIVTLSSNPARTATSGADGAFAFDGLVGRPYTLVARAAGGVAGPVTVRATASTGVIVLRLKPAGAVTETVVDRSSKPVAGATVALRGLDAPRAAPARRRGRRRSSTPRARPT